LAGREPVSRSRRPAGAHRAVRQKLGLSQGRFAVRIGVTRNIVLRYEGGNGRPRADTLERIAQLGGVSVDWLLRGDRRPPEGPREWDDAVRLLRAAWREPSRRELVRRVLRALAR
jgi:transcriptional regulator with XRE-family HTH domain